MILKYSFKTAVNGLKAHRSRSILTILGIVIGITSIILVVSLGEGAQNLILSQIKSIGSKVIAVAPGRKPKGPTDFASLFTDSLKQKDIDLLQQKSNVPHLSTIMPIVFGSESVAWNGDTYRTNIFGVTEMFAKVYDMYPNEGRIFSDDEVKGYAEVAVIGSKVRDELFGNSDPLDQKIKIKGRNFRVVGILPNKGQVSFVNFDDAVIIPYTAGQQYIFGIKYFHRLVIEADDEKNVPETVQDITLTLRNSHNITDPAKDDFFIETQTEAIDMVGTILNVLTLFLTAIAAISLLVGGIGIMNIMLVSVTERTTEIGLRKALGATKGNILTQFLLEAVILTALGGVIGVVLGALFSYIISLILGKVMNLAWTFTFPVSAALLGIGVAACVGLIFGIYPAKQAASKSPIEALRYE
jgi:putative ABC transport system permease protein